MSLGYYQLQFQVHVKSARMAKRHNFIFRVCENGYENRKMWKYQVIFFSFFLGRPHIYSYTGDDDVEVRLNHKNTIQKHIKTRIFTQFLFKPCLLPLLLLTAPPWCLEPLESLGGPYCAKLLNIQHPQRSTRLLVLQIGY